MSSRIVLTTGGNKGLGLAIIETLAQRSPADIYLLASRDVKAGEEAVQNLRKKGIKSEIQVIQLDVLNDGDIEKASNHVKEKYGRLDVLINNAGILRLPTSSTLSALRETYTDLVNTNLISVAIVTTAFLPLLQLSTHPKVINITSGLASIANTLDPAKKMGRFPPYGASKVGLNGLTVHMQVVDRERVEKALTQDEAGKGQGEKGAMVKFFVVAPGVLKTAFTRFTVGKDPLEGTEAVVKLALEEVYEGGTQWEFEGGEMRQIPW